MIHSARHSSEKCKVLGEFRTKYSAAHPVKDPGRNPISGKRFQEKQEIHTIINNVVYELRMIEPKKVISVNHKAPECLESNYD